MTKLPDKIFITGTSTEVGKTVVTAGLLRALRQRGVDAVPMKPVQTGGEPDRTGTLQAPDLCFCLSVTGMTPDNFEMALMNPYVYEPACSPHLAGRMAGSYPNVDHIVNCAEELAAKHDCVLIEGAGGIMVPLNEDTLALDLIQHLNAPVILVAHAGLGTINHTLLSINTLRQAGLEVLGVIFNEVTPTAEEDRFIADDNPDAIARFGEVEILGSIRYAESIEEESVFWNQFEDLNIML